MRVEENKVVTLEFTVYDNDTNEKLEATADLGPFFYIHGIGAFIPKIEEALEEREKGYTTTLTLTPEEGYGDYDEDLIDEMLVSDFDEEFDEIKEGMEFIADMDDGSEVTYVIKKIDGDKVIVDGNHPFAGKTLRFEVKVDGIRDASDEELEHGHPHFNGFED